jgi:hypothetical protein
MKKPIRITRRLALQLRTVFRRALGLTRGFGPALWFATGRDGIRARARFGDAAVEYHAEAELSKEEMWLPFDFLADVEARRDDPVELQARPDGHIVAGWRDGDVPQCVRYDLLKSSDVDDFPKLPKQLVQNPPRLLCALRDAMLTTDPDARRYATDHVQLRGGRDTIVATDGRQMLLEDGFQFPWDDDVLIRRTKVFGSGELGRDQPVAIGKTDDWVAVRVGPWTILLRIGKDLRFPDVDRHVPKAEDAKATARISPADTEFLLKTLPRLPTCEEFNHPVTVDLDGTVAIRARAETQRQPTELLLSNSTCSGAPMRINTNREYLVRAVKLGFDRVHLYTPKVLVMCRDEHRCYVWALLSPDSAIPPSMDAIRIASADVPTTNPKRSKRRKPDTMAQKKSNKVPPVDRNPKRRTRAEQPADRKGVRLL